MVSLRNENTKSILRLFVPVLSVQLHERRHSGGPSPSFYVAFFSLISSRAFCVLYDTGPALLPAITLIESTSFMVAKVVGLRYFEN